MIECTRGGGIDDHTRFLMRFNGNFNVEGNPTPSGNLFIANNGKLVNDQSIQCVEYRIAEEQSYTIINTKESLLPELFYDGHPFTIDFWYKSLSNRSKCIIDHQYSNGIFNLGLYNSDCFTFHAQQVSWDFFDADVNEWHHIAIIRDIGEYNMLYVFIDGKYWIATKCNNMTSLRSFNIGINARSDGRDNGDSRIDDFRISDIARWDSDFEPPKRKGL